MIQSARTATREQRISRALFLVAWAWTSSSWCIRHESVGRAEGSYRSLVGPFMLPVPQGPSAIVNRCDWHVERGGINLKQPFRTPTIWDWCGCIFISVKVAGQTGCLHYTGRLLSKVTNVLPKMFHCADYIHT